MTAKDTTARSFSIGGCLSTIVVILAHLAGWVIVASVLVVVAPPILKYYEEYDLELPAVSIAAFQLSMICINYWYMLVPFLMGLDLAICLLPRNPHWLALWTAIVLTSLIGLTALLLVGFLLPLAGGV